MSRPTERERCRKCGRHRDEVGRMSWTGQCEPCGDAELLANVRELIAHNGPRFDRWRRGLVASVGGVLRGELETTDEEAKRAASP